MSIPEPKPGLVVQFSYLWAHEHALGREAGVKDRPAVIVVAVEEGPANKRRVTVAPITHSEPKSPSDGIEIPADVKRNLGLDDVRSWIVVSEANRFVWPGPDIRPIPGSNPRRYHYGFIPPRLYDRVLQAFISRWSKGADKPTPR